MVEEINGNYFRLINAESKRGKDMICTHEHAKTYTLEQLYKLPSCAKQEAYSYCLRVCRDVDGYEFRVHSANCYNFSASFKTDLGLVYITRERNYIVC